MTKKQILGYMSYPLTKGSFRKNKAKVERLALKIMSKNPHIYVITAHHSTHYSDKNGELYRSISFDLKLIEKCDLFIIGSNKLDYEESSGSVWEFGFAKFLGKPIVKACELLESD